MFEVQKFEIDPTLFSTKAVGVLYGIFTKQVEPTTDRKMEFFHFFFIT